MKYKNASSILPPPLVEKLQNYIQGEYLYIPIKEDQHKSWGDKTGSRIKTARRNELIRNDYRLGATIEELSDTYFLSIHTIRKIVYSK